MRAKGLLAGVLAVLGLGLPVATAPQAVPQTRASISVTTTDDVLNPFDGVTSLREAFSAANATAGEADTIELAPGATYVLSGCIGPGQEDSNLGGDLDHIDATGQLTIVGNGATIEQSCQRSDERVIQSVGPKLVLNDLTITGGDIGTNLSMTGGGVHVDGDLELTGVTITNNLAGAVANVGDPHFTVIGAGLSVGGDLDATNSLISDNAAIGTDTAVAGGGGAIVSGNAVLDHTEILDNLATTGAGGLWVVGDLTAISSGINNNNAGTNGAALVGGGLTLIDAGVNDNTADSGIVRAETVTATDSAVGTNTAAGGAVLDAETILLTDSTVTANSTGVVVSATGSGPDVGSALEMHRSTINANASTGSTVDVVAAGAFIIDSTISGNVSTGGGPVGAGIKATAGMYLQESTVADNTSFTSDPNGFAGVRTVGPVTIVDSTVDNNIGATTEHAGVWVDDRLAVTTSTVSDNRAADENGSAAGVVGGGEVVISISTITGNAADRAGVVGDDVFLYQSTVAYNDAVQASVTADTFESQASIVTNVSLSLTPTCEVPPGATTSAGWNVVSGNGCALTLPSDRTVSSVSLAELANNGGPTQTMLPLSLPLRIPKLRSACFGADQRGVVRPVGFACEPGSVEVALGPPPQTFSDVPLDHPFFAEVDCLVMMGATEGFADGTFRPTANITRQAVVAWLWRLVGSPAPSGPPTFSDVPASHPFAQAIAWATEAGIAQGFADGTFRPSASVTRQAVAAWLWRQGGQIVLPGGSGFPDVPASHPFADAIKWLVDEEITTGFADGTFRPGNNITRMALAAWVCRDDSL